MFCASEWTPAPMTWTRYRAGCRGSLHAPINLVPLYMSLASVAARHMSGQLPCGGVSVEPGALLCGGQGARGALPQCRTLPQVGGRPCCEEGAGPQGAPGRWGTDMTYAQEPAHTWSDQVDPVCCPARHACPPAFGVCAHALLAGSVSPCITESGWHADTSRPILEKAVMSGFS